VFIQSIAFSLLFFRAFRVALILSFLYFDSHLLILYIEVLHAINKVWV